MARFDNKVAIVTGSGGGNRQAYAEALARDGAAVVVADINAKRRRGWASRSSPTAAPAISIPVDVSDPRRPRNGRPAAVGSSAASTTW